MRKPLTLQGSDYAKAVERLNVVIDRADGLLSESWGCILYSLFTLDPRPGTL
jgi:hypothetical protein